jgi:DNA polymerase-2
LEGIYRWVVFLPSRVDGRTPVANRYFGVFGDGSLKVRGIEARRRDTPPFVARAQMAILQQLAAAQRLEEVAGQLPAAARLLRGELRRLSEGRVPLEELLATQKVSRELALYRTPSPAARAAMQLAALGKSVRPGMTVRFLYVRGETGVHAWDCPPPPPVKQVDVAVYGKLLLRAAASVLQPWADDSQRECEIWPALENKLRTGEFAMGS